MQAGLIFQVLELQACAIPDLKVFWFRTALRKKKQLSMFKQKLNKMSFRIPTRPMGTLCISASDESNLFLPSTTTQGLYEDSPCAYKFVTWEASSLLCPFLPSQPLICLLSPWFAFSGRSWSFQTGFFHLAVYSRLFHWLAAQTVQ